MDILLTTLGAICILVGIIGSFIPVIPGPPLSWLGLLLLYNTEEVPLDLWFIVVTGVIALLATLLDYYLPVVGTKKYGGSKRGVWGAIIGLFVAVFFPILGPFGILIWPFLGAFLWELSQQKSQKNALRAAWGSFVGFLAGTLIKLGISLVYAGIFMYQLWV
jgi:uncharacterized protein YqgC (DUF456 family)